MIEIEKVTRSDLLKVCKYYKGEDKRPASKNEMFWNYEQAWVNLRMDEDSDLLHAYLNDYDNAGLLDFEQNDGTPATLKALLFNRFCYWSSGTMLDCVEPFKEFYTKHYSDNPKDNPTDNPTDNR